MKTYLLDANIVLRFLLDDVAPQADATEDLIAQAADGQARLMLPVPLTGKRLSSSTTQNCRPAARRERPDPLGSNWASQPEYKNGTGHPHEADEAAEGNDARGETPDRRVGPLLRRGLRKTSNGCLTRPAS